MGFSGKVLGNFLKIRSFPSLKRNFTAGKIIYNKQQVQSGSGGNVPGLSAAVVKLPNEPVGPGASKSSNYKNPEYFCYDKNSYFEAEVEMVKFRLPQPDNTKYYKPSSK